MRTRTFAAATLTALALAGAGTAPALAHAPAQHQHGKSAAAHAAHKPAKTSFVLGGTVTAVDAAAPTISFTVNGGRDKALRGTVVTVKVADTAKITREDSAATLADVKPGDHVSTKGVTLDGVRTASRVSAEASDAASPATS